METSYTAQVLTMQTISVRAETLQEAISTVADQNANARVIAVSDIAGVPVDLRCYAITGLRSTSDLLILSVDHAGDLIDGQAAVSSYDSCFEDGEATVYGDTAFATSPAVAVWAVHHDMVTSDRQSNAQSGGSPDDTDKLDSEWTASDRIRTALLTAPAAVAAPAAWLLAGITDDHLVAACASMREQLEAFAGRFTDLPPAEAHGTLLRQYQAIAAQAATAGRHSMP